MLSQEYSLVRLSAGSHSTGLKLFFSPVIQNQTSSALQMPVKYVWWCLPFTMWLLLITEILGIIHIFVPKQTAEETLPPQEIDA